MELIHSLLVGLPRNRIETKTLIHFEDRRGDARRIVTAVGGHTIFGEGTESSYHKLDEQIRHRIDVERRYSELPVWEEEIYHGLNGDVLPVDLFDFGRAAPIFLDLAPIKVFFFSRHYFRFEAAYIDCVICYIIPFNASIPLI